MKLFVILKHVFIPHDENDYKPHFFREVGVSLLLFVSVFLLGTSAGSSFFIHKTVLGAEVAASVLVDLTNESRVENNESPLLRNPKLERAAQLKGEDMSANQYFSHNSPAGVTPWHWFRQAGYNFLYAGENLAINFTDSSDVEKAWLNSPTHRANIMNAEFREIGIATVRGYYKDYPTIYIVQMFGTPAYGGNLNEKDALVVKKISQIKKAPVVSTSTDVVGDVKGETVVAVNISSSSPDTTASGTREIILENVQDTQEMAIVKNASAEPLMEGKFLNSVSYSKWYEKFLFKFSYYIDFIYKVLLLVIAFALVTMVLVEIRKQHYVHIAYGISLLLLLTAFIYINQSFF